MLPKMITKRPRSWCETARIAAPLGRARLPARARRGKPLLVGKPSAHPPLGCPAPHRDQPLPGAKDLSGFGHSRAINIHEAEDKTSKTIIQKIFDELPAP